MLLRHHRIFFLFLGMVHCGAALPLRAQAPQPSPSPTPEEPVEAVQSGFILFTLLNKPAALKCMIGTNNVVLDASADPVGGGYASSLMPWRPAKAALRAEAKGYSPAELRPFLQPGETPVVVLQERTPGSFTFSIIKNADNRGGPFYDAINLSAQPSLTLTANGKKIRLPKGERMRIGTEKTVKFSVEGGPADILESMEDPSHLVLFYSKPSGKLGFSVVPDMPLQ
jgi:hypothetical protein